MRVLYLILACFISLTSAAQELILQSGHHSPVRLMAFSDDGAILASADEGGIVNIWDMNSRLQLHSFHGHHTGLVDITMTNEKQVISAGKDSSIIRYPKSGIQLEQIQFDAPVRAIDAFGTQVLIYAGGFHTLQNSTPVSTGFSVDGEVVAMAHVAVDTVVLLTHKPNRLIVTDPSGSYTLSKRIKADEIDIDRNHIYVRGENFVHAYTLIDGELENFWHGHHPSAMTLDVTGMIVNKEHVVVNTSKGIITYFNKADGYIDHKIKKKHLEFTGLAYSPATDIMIEATADNALTLWDSDAYKVFHQFESNLSPITEVAYHEPSNRLLIVQNNGSAKIWNFDQTLNPIRHRHLRLKSTSKGLTYPHFDHVRKFDDHEAVYMSYKIFKENPLDLNWRLGRNYQVTWDFDLDKMFIKDEPIVEEFKRMTNFNDLSAFFTVSDDFQDSSENASIRLVDNVLKMAYKGQQSEAMLPSPELVSDVILAGTKPYGFICTTQGLIECYDLRTGQRVMRLLAPGTNDFIMIDEDNHYFASKGALQSIAFEVDGKVLPYEQFDVRYNSPEKVLTTWPFFEDEAVIKAFKSAHQKRLDKLVDASFDSDRNLPEIEATASEYSTEEPKVDLQIRASSEDTLQAIHIEVNGVPVYLDTLDNIGRKEINWEAPLALSAGINNIDLYAEDLDGLRSLKHSLTINRNVRRVKSNLYLVTIGAGTYANNEFNLKYAEKDADDVEKIFRRNHHFHRVKRLALRGEEVDKENLNKVEEFVSKAGIDDVVILFYAGHGVLDDSFNYYLAAHHTDFTDPAAHSIAYSDLENILNTLQCRQKLLLLDACHSGEVDETEMFSGGNGPDILIEENIVFRSIESNLGAEAVLDSRTSFELSKQVFADLRESSGTVVISSASGSEVAIEGDKWRNGIFTYAMVNGLKRREADTNFDGEISVLELQTYVQNEVERMTHGRQQPTSRKENLQNNFRVW